ncbi:MAG: hypothetical protein QM534_10085 [Sediminibacterium sp.]|nr:hypothetical protein [Sediminibacterium sp.]
MTVKPANIAFYFLFILTLLWGLKASVIQVFGAHFSYYPGDLCDVRFIACVLEHDWQWLCGNTPGVFQALFMFPEPNAITYSDNLLGNLPLYALFRGFNASVFQAFQGWLVLTVALNFMCGFVAFNDFLKDRWFALLAAFLFTFSLALIGQYVHIQMVARYPVPLVFMFLNRFLKSEHTRDILYAALMLVFQFYLSIYLGLLLTFGAAVFVMVAYFFSSSGKKINRRLLMEITAILVLAFVLLLPLLWPYYQRTQTAAYPYFREVLPTVPGVATYFRAFYGSTFWPTWALGTQTNPYAWLHVLFPGALVLVGLIAAVVYVYKTKDKQLGWWLLVMGILVLCFFQIGGYSPLALIRKLPGFGTIRVGTRIINILMFFFALIPVYVLQAYSKDKRPTVKITIVLLALVLSFADQHNDWHEFKQTSLKESEARVQNVVKSVQSRYIPGKHKAFALVTDHFDETSFNAYQVDAMLAAYQIGIPTVNVYSSFAPVDYQDFWKHSTPEHLQKWLIHRGMDTTQVVMIER